MMEDKELPSEYVSIRQVWIKSINRVAESIAYRFKHDVSDQWSEQTGQQTVIESIISLRALLVDYGEAPIRTEVDEWHEKHRKEMSNADSYKLHNIYRRWFEYMVQTLNKYGMLFDSQPQGYSNVIMEEIIEGEKENGFNGPL